MIKLSDFGLSRFIEIDETTGESELLWTRCGSEAYAAPELVMGTGSVRAQAQAAMKRRGALCEGDEGHTRGFYDARETDAWACGVVLYALVGRRLPFGEGVGAVQDDQRQGRIGGDGAPGHGHGRGSASERRQWLMKIARGEYEWPSSASESTADVATNGHADDAEELVGQELVKSEGVKRIVGRLLVRDPRKRARIMDLWNDGWMWGLGGGLALGMTEAGWRERDSGRQRERVGLGIDFGHDDGKVSLEEDVGSRADDQLVSEEVGEGVTIDVDDVDEDQFLDEGLRDGNGGEEGEGEEGEECEEVVDGEEGWLLDQEGIGSVARQEVV